MPVPLFTFRKIHGADVIRHCVLELQYRLCTALQQASTFRSSHLLGEDVDVRAHIEKDESTGPAPFYLPLSLSLSRFIAVPID